MELYRGMQEQLQCWYCHHTVSFGPVLLSSKGKNVCGRCRAPKKPEGEVFLRNLYYEKLASVHHFPCKNKGRGCTVVLGTEELRLHEGVCTFNTHGCPTQALDNKCLWSGQLGHIAGHYREKHSELIIEHPIIMKPDIKRSYVRNMVFNFVGFDFVFQQKCDVARHTLWHNVVLLGPPHLAGLFTYTVKISKGLDSIIKGKPVQPYGRFLMYEVDSVKQNVTNIFRELGDYDEVAFHFR